MRSFSALGLFCLHNPFLEPAGPQKWPWRLQYVHQGVPGPLFPTEGCESCIASKDLCAYVGTWTGRGVSSCWKVQQTVLWQLSLWNQALATTTILAWLGPNLLSQRCYLVSLGQQGRHVCPVWTAEGNKCLRNSMKKAVDLSPWTAWKSEGWREEWQPMALEARWVWRRNCELLGRADCSGAHSCSCPQDTQHILRACSALPQAAISMVFPNPKRGTVK